MHNRQETALDWSVVAHRLTAIRQENQLLDNTTALAYLVLGNRYDLIGPDINDLITDGGDDRGVDAVYIDDREDAPCIRFYQFKCHEKQASVSKNFPSNEIDKILNFISDLFNKDKGMKKSCNPLLWQKVVQIWDCFDKIYPEIEVHFISNGQPLLPAHRERIASALSEYRFASFYESSFSDVADIVVGGRKRARKTIHKISVVDKQYFERIDGNIRGLIATIEAKTLIEIISLENGKKINHGLFDDNIRVYLGSDNPVNNEIINSAVGEENSLFWYLNNGITIVCEAFRYVPTRSPCIEVENLQIVNGAQTSYALFEAFNRAPDATANILVLIKLYETRVNGLAHKVAIATNSQTRIQNRDLMSNHSIQKKIESAFYDSGYFYERKKNQHVDKPANQRIDALRLGQIILSYHLRLPERAKTDSDKIFGNLYDEIFSPKHDAGYLLLMHNLYMKIDRHREKAVAKSRSGVFKRAGEPDNTFLVYGQYHVLYLVAVLLEKRGIKNPSDDNIDSLIDEAISIVRDKISKKGEIAHYNFFRNPRTKEKLYQEAWVQQLSFFD